MDDKFKKLCKDFINNLKDRKPSRDLSAFAFDYWYKSAFSTAQRPLGVLMKNGIGYESWKAKNYEGLKNSIFNLLKTLSPNGVKSLTAEIQYIANKYDVPFGIVQKIVCVLFKYIITNYYGEFDKSNLKENFTWVVDEDFVKKLPVPVDSIVLTSLKGLNANLNIHVYNTSVKINGRPWSKATKADWDKIQDEINRLSGGNNMGFEMDSLWR